MYTRFQLVKKYIQHYRTASNGKGHGMHSPFVFNFIQQVLKKEVQNPEPQIEVLRNRLLQNRKKLTITDLGAGSRIKQTSHVNIRHIARTAVKPKKWSLLLYRLVQHYKPQTIMELGTSLGISTAYLSRANKVAKIITIEGSAEIQQEAAAHFAALGIDTIKSVHGAFDVVLPSILNTLNVVDLAYIDGNHRLQPTLHYFELLLAKRSAQAIFIFDDIHWSAEMEEAWRQIQQHPEVGYTIDLFFMGLVFFRDEFKVKQHFKIRF